MMNLIGQFTPPVAGMKMVGRQIPIVTGPGELIELLIQVLVPQVLMTITMGGYPYMSYMNG